MRMLDKWERKGGRQTDMKEDEWLRKQENRTRGDGVAMTSLGGEEDTVNERKVQNAQGDALYLGRDTHERGGPVAGAQTERYGCSG